MGCSEATTTYVTDTILTVSKIFEDSHFAM